MPMVNFRCLVLWRNTYIPTNEPMLPPIIAIQNKTASGIRKALLFALSLSIPISKNPIKLTKQKYNAMKNSADGSIIFNILTPF